MLPRRMGTIVAMVRVFARGPIFVAALIMCAFGLGYWGYRSAAGGYDVADSLYRSLQLFNIDMQVSAGEDPPWQLEVARFLAPLSIAYAAIAALFALLRDQAQRLSARLFARDHVVVVGLGDRGATLARHLSRSHRVIGVELDPANGAVAAARRRGITVVIGDGRDPEVLSGARVDRAKHVVVLATDDSTNLDVIGRLSTLLDHRSPAVQHAALEGTSLWAQLDRLPLRREVVNRRVDFFSIPDRIADLLLKRGAHRPGWGAGAVLVRGEGAVAARLLIRIARDPTLADSEPLRLASRNSEAVLSEVTATDPWVLDRVELVEVAEAFAPTAFVCGLADAEALTAAMAIVRRGKVERMMVQLSDSDLNPALRASGLQMPGVDFVPAKQIVLSGSVIAQSAIEVIARGRHADYVAQQKRRGDTAKTNPSLLEWEELPESLRESNRRFAEGVADALAQLGAVLVPLTGSKPAPDLQISPEKLDHMARREHDRWTADQIRDGWKPTDGPKDPDRKLHPMLVPWERLSEEERAKDRDAILALPQLLASVGYELRMPSEP